MTDTDRKRLRELAERATRGPWRHDGVDIVQLTDGGQGYPLNYYQDGADIIRGQCDLPIWLRPLRDAIDQMRAALKGGG